MIVAPFPIASGAADVALLMRSSFRHLARGHTVLLRNSQPGNEKDRAAENQRSLSHCSSPPQVGQWDYSTPALAGTYGLNRQMRLSHLPPSSVMNSRRLLTRSPGRENRTGKGPLPEFRAPAALRDKLVARHDVSCQKQEKSGGSE